MDLAFAEAEAAGLLGEVPIGAVVVSASGEVLASAGNRTLSFAIRPRMPSCSPSARLAPSSAASGSSTAISTSRSSLAPCALRQSPSRGIRRLYFGAPDPKGGAVEHGPRFFAQPTCHHAPEVYGGIGEARAAELLKRFFAARR